MPKKYTRKQLDRVWVLNIEDALKEQLKHKMLLPLKKRVREEEQALGVRVYKHFYGAHHATICQLPKAMRSKDRRIAFFLSENPLGQPFRFHGELPIDEDCVMPIKSNSSDLVIDSQSELGAVLMNFFRLEHDILRAGRVYRSVGALRKAWADHQVFCDLDQLASNFLDKTDGQRLYEPRVLRPLIKDALAQKEAK